MDGHFLKRNQRNLKILLIIGPLLVGSILFVVSNRIYTGRREAMNLLKRSYEEREWLNGLRDDLDELQAGETGFLLTGDEAYLRAHQFSYDDISVRLASLNKDRPAQVEQWQQLQKLVEAKLAQYRDVTSLKENGQDDKALKLAHGDGKTSIIDQIRSAIGEIQVAEDEMLTSRKRANESKLDTSDVVSTGLLFLSATVVIYAGVLVLRIRQLQSIITICAWTQKVNFNGKWMPMEEYLWHRFRVKVSHGISEEAFDGVMGMVGKNLTVSDGQPAKISGPKPQPDVEKGL
ncbi:MAG: CHASE3 domain-containing protein [Verrucomicrobia bacterium]|nr:CHASE3 domain-containing protein [Verrucomicrobiota bacterium]